MTHLEKIKTALDAIDAARNRATPGEWVVQQKTLSNFDHPYVFDRTYGAIFEPLASSTKLINRPNCDFVALSANEIKNLTSALRIAGEALKNECHCTGELDYGGNRVTCYACDSLKTIAETLCKKI